MRHLISSNGLDRFIGRADADCSANNDKAARWHIFIPKKLNLGIFCSALELKRYFKMEIWKI
jgi:hypothetical protein